MAAAAMLFLAACNTPPSPTATPVSTPMPPTATSTPLAPTPTPTAAPASAAVSLVSPVPRVDSQWLVVVERTRQRITVYRDGQAGKSYAVSTGKSETITPVGWWKIVEKRRLDPPGIYGTRWLGFQRWNPMDGRYEWYAESPPFGIHGTNEPDKIGTAVSAGCVRLRNADVEELYEQLPLGTYVVVVD